MECCEGGVLPCWGGAQGGRMAARFPNASQFYLRAITSPVIPRIAAKFRAIPRNAAQFYAIQEQFREIPLNPAQRNPDWKS